ncbi:MULTISPECIES: NUDIX domain-containing protein [unclassified Paenibacillus]|uniref:NUDIX domain-containing protein n=1 Tax=unclassified Paenibacillus TaxID=185978 RepID=UPI00362BAB35
MPICINRRGDIFEQFIEIPEEQIESCSLQYPLTHALIVARSVNGFLLLYNTWKKHWELAGGMLEEGESLRECALREMLEETNQIPDKIQFMGLMKFVLASGRTEYGGLYCAFIEKERPFEENAEAKEIVFWDQAAPIGYIDEIDQQLLNYYPLLR